MLFCHVFPLAMNRAGQLPSPLCDARLLTSSPRYCEAQRGQPRQVRAKHEGTVIRHLNRIYRVLFKEIGQRSNSKRAINIYRARATQIREPDEIGPRYTAASRESAATVEEELQENIWLTHRQRQSPVAANLGPSSFMTRLWRAMRPHGVGISSMDSSSLPLAEGLSFDVQSQ